MALWPRRNPQQRHAPDPVRALVEQSPDIVMLLASDGSVRYQSPAVEPAFGFDAGDLPVRDPWSAVYPADRPRLDQYLASAGRGSAQPPIEIRIRHSSGDWRFLELTATSLKHDPSAGGILTTARDITQRRRVEERLAHQAYTDPLTSLANRTRLMRDLARALTEQDGHGEALAVIFLDLDGFKLVNDSLGHIAGDQVLATIAGRLARVVRPGDVVARFGGDEFVVLMPRTPHAELAMRTAAHLIRVVGEPIPLSNRDVVVGASAGVVFAPAGTVCADDLIRDADTALYAAKEQGKGRAVLFTPEMNEQALGRLTLEGELRTALDRGQFQVFYQPTLNLLTEEIVGAEALVRWQHPNQGLVMPGRFIPVIEEMGMMPALGRVVLEESCIQARRWQNLRPERPPLPVSVNLSARQFEQPDLAEQALKTVFRNGIAPEAVRFEITESTLLRDVASTHATLQVLRSAGLRLALDDFGTGFSSLSYLRQFHTDTLKVDQSFIAGLEGDAGAAAIVRAITSLAHALKMEVTVEGVETAGQLHAVRRLACDTGQGYYFSQALPADEMFDLLRSPASAWRAAS